MNIKVVWAFALISVCIFLAAAHDDNDDNDSDSARSSYSRRTSTIAPEINENEEKGISVSFTGGVDASVDTPPYIVKNNKYAGVTINDGYDDNRVVKKRLVKRKRVKTYVNTEETPTQAEGQVVVSIKKRRRPVIKRNRVHVYVNRRPFFKRKRFQAGIYVDYTTTEPPNVYIGPYNRGEAVIKKKNLRISVDNNSDEDLDYVKRLPIKRKRISIDTDVHVQKRPVVVAKKVYRWNVGYNKDVDEYPPPTRVYKNEYD